MDSTIFAGIVGGIATIMAGIISPILTNWIKERKMNKYIPVASLYRKDTLYGTWKGVLDQKVGKEFICNSHDTTIVFSQNSNPVTGEIDVNFKIRGEEVVLDGDTTVKGILINTIYNGHLFKTDYVNKDNNAIHFGTIYGELSADGRSIQGNFFGYGIISEMFVSGTLKLTKQLRKS